MPPERTTRLAVRVIPRSRRNSVEWENGNVTLKVRLTAPPVDGAANEALIALLAGALHLPRRSITIIQGVASRQKVVQIEGMTIDEIKRQLQA
jgi:uncharacterized protein (TIGR00251 family)